MYEIIGLSIEYHRCPVMADMLTCKPVDCPSDRGIGIGKCGRTQRNCLRINPVHVHHQFAQTRTIKCVVMIGRIVDGDDAGVSDDFAKLAMSPIKQGPDDSPLTRPDT